MEKKIVKWLTDTSGLIARLGKWSVGSVSYDAMSYPRDTETGRFRAKCRLPGKRPVLGNFRTQEEAMKIVEDTVEWWLKGAGLWKRK